MHTSSLPKPLLSRRAPTRAALALALLASLAAPLPAAAQTASELYERAQTRATTARATPTVTAFRGAVTAYELVVRRYPRSGLCDDALWNGAQTARLAWEKFQQPADLASATRLLTWLRREYPASPWKAQAAAQLTALSQPPASATPQASPTAAPANVAASAPVPVATVRRVTLTTLSSGDRLTIELDREVLVAPERIADPSRLVLELRRTKLDPGVAATLEGMAGSRLVTVRMGRQDEQAARLVLTLAGTPRHSVFALYHPYRLVVDVEDEPAIRATSVSASGGAPAPPPPVVASPRTTSRAPSKPAPPAGLPPAAPSATSSGDYSLARQLGLGISRIVIDAGHGGHDPGAQANGLVESDLVLDIAKRVEVLLKKQPGIDVVLTRRTDTFIPLEERTAIANREGADLFLSIHANASSRAAARGVETYFLNFATNADAEAVAARENAGSRTSMGKLPQLVQQIALHNKMKESREFAQLVQTNMVRSMRAQNKALTDLGVKQAPFVVLIGAQMPSVLAELSFLTNKAEAALLKKDAYRQKIAQALADAVLKYQTSLKKVTTAAAATGR